MARQRQDTQSRDSQPRESRQTGRGTGMRAPGDTASADDNVSAGNVSGGTGSSGASMQGAGQPIDQERQRRVAREPGATGSAGAGTGMQRAGARQSGTMGTAMTGAGQGQPSLLPAFMANPGLMAGAFMSNPFAFAQAMSQEMDRIFSAFGAGDAGGSLGAAGTGAQPGHGLTRGGSPQGLRQVMSPGMGQGMGQAMGQWMPQMEVLQRENELVVRADLPGLGPEDVEVDLEDGILTISGERRQESEERQEGLYRSERSYGTFSRSIALPEGVDEDQVHARFDNGVLEVSVPVSQQRQRGRRIQVQSGAAASSGQRTGQRASGQIGRNAGSEPSSEASA